MSKSSKMATLICGVAMGVAIGYFLNSEKKDEYLDIAKEKAGKLKEKAGELKNKVKDKLNKKSDELEEVATN
ncbi:MAG TPA: hypothetical protein VFX43_21865 [Chitinophagaceae bacterium]|jgi:hypothetical protein|nr:hypothetical protein [Chitinophagaceae bacterium]